MKRCRLPGDRKPSQSGSQNLRRTPSIRWKTAQSHHHCGRPKAGCNRKRTRQSASEMVPSGHLRNAVVRELRCSVIFIFLRCSVILFDLRYSVKGPRHGSHSTNSLTNWRGTPQVAQGARLDTERYQRTHQFACRDYFIAREWRFRNQTGHSADRYGCPRA